MKSLLFISLLAFFSFTAVTAQNDECSICEFLVDYIEGYIAENQTETQIIKTLDAFCTLLPTQDKTACENFVQEGVPEVIAYLKANENGQIACTQVGVCSSLSELPKKLPTSTDDCDFCKTAVGWVEGYLKQNQTEQEVVASIEVLCSALPSQYTSQCDTFVENYVPLAINYIEQDQDPQTVCTELQLCASSTIEVSGFVSIKIN